MERSPPVLLRVGVGDTHMGGNVVLPALTNLGSPVEGTSTSGGKSHPIISAPS